MAAPRATAPANTCPICAKPIAPHPGAGRPRAYCSHACRQIAYRRRKHGLHRSRLVTLVQADARTWLPTLPAESVDLIATDPPYHFNRGASGYFHEWFEELPDTAWPHIFAHLYRILRRDRHAYIFCDRRTLAMFDQAAHDAGFRVHDPLVWDKDWLGLGATWRSCYELIAYYQKGRRPGNHTTLGNLLRHRRPHRQFPSQKPVPLLETLIRQATQPGELILDPFCGSATTGIAARNLNRHAVLADINTVAAERRLRLRPAACHQVEE
ncbi:MAG TPA: DNA methyltransferase [Phenylobacterium sp.]|nr:DNA methyltransferase [Phenylobacterium sp.]